MTPDREQTISRLTELIFPENMQAGVVNEKAHDIVTTILAYLDDPDITHLYYEGVATGLEATVTAAIDGIRSGARILTK